MDMGQLAFGMHLHWRSLDLREWYPGMHTGRYVWRRSYQCACINSLQRIQYDSGHQTMRGTTFDPVKYSAEEVEQSQSY
jgi:hypothetical protein